MCPFIVCYVPCDPTPATGGARTLKVKHSSRTWHRDGWLSDALGQVEREREQEAKRKVVCGRERGKERVSKE